MKKLSFIALILLASAFVANGQEINTKTRLSADQNVPLAVLAAIEAHNPGLTFQQQLMEVVPVPEKEKKIRKAKKTIPTPPQLYQVLSSGKNYKKKELYDQDGVLVYSKEKIRNAALPRAALTFIGREYNGWVVKKDLAVRIISLDGRESQFYNIVLRNGKEKKRITLNEQGLIYVRK